MTPAAWPDGRSAAGVTIWKVLPGRELGQRTGLRHLTWAGQGDAVHLHDSGGTAEDGVEYAGRDAGTVGGPCETEQEAREGAYAYLATLDQEPPPWLGEILRAGGDVSPATATEIRRAAEYGYHADPGRGEAWAQWAARDHAKGALAGMAVEGDPAVQAALLAAREARGHADALHAAAAGPDGRADLGTEAGLAAWLASQEADEWYAEYGEAHSAARERHSAEVARAWREADIRFLRSHRAELEAADADAFSQVLGASAALRDAARADVPSGPDLELAPRWGAGIWGERLPEPDWQLYTPAGLAEFWGDQVRAGEVVTADRARELWASEHERTVARLEEIRVPLMQERRRRLAAGSPRPTVTEAGLADELARQAAQAGMTVLAPDLAGAIREAAWEYRMAEGQWPGWYRQEHDDERHAAEAAAVRAAEMEDRWRHLRDDHRADPATVARDAPDAETAGFIDDAAHEYPDAPWGELVARGQGEAWWQARDCEQGQEPREDPAEWRAFFREVLGRDMPLNAGHQARLSQLDAAGPLTEDTWTAGPGGTTYLHGFDPRALAAELGGLSFPQLYQQRYRQAELAVAGRYPGGHSRDFPGGLAAGVPARPAPARRRALRGPAAVTRGATP